MRGDDECAYMLTTPLVQLMLSTALNSLVDAFNLLLRGQLEKRAVLENLDLILLCLDEAVDGAGLVEHGVEAGLEAELDLGLRVGVTITFRN